MPRVLRRILHRPALKLGTAGDPRGRFRDQRFASFIAASNRKTINTDFQDFLLKSRRFLRYGLMAAVACGFAWILVESAHALSIF